MALRSLFSIERGLTNFEVIVVNNDEKEEWALRCLAEKLPFRLVSSAKNVGFGGGANLGAAQATGEIIGFLNPDILWKTPILSRIDTFFQSQKQHILGINLVGEDGESEPWSSGVAPSLWELFKNNVLPQSFRQRISTKNQLEWVSGGGLFLEKRFFQSLGGFDEGFFLYFEDVDLCVRARAQEMWVSCDAEIMLRHLGGKSFSDVARQKKYFYASQIQYFTKHRPVVERRCLEIFHRIVHSI
ncbi:MAG: glycosyltransferase [Candidatus Moraniibacteriota bacterium]